MIPSEQQRRAYLDALGIDVWLPRDSADAPVEDAEGAPTAPAGEVDWETLAAQVAGCQKCALSGSRTQTVFGVGHHDADWMVVGEAPGAEEDRRGEPFVGRAGQLLDEMLRAVGLDRDRVFIANILKCRPPDNRDPKQEEADACRSHLDRQIALVQPKLILAVGRIAAQQLLGRNDPVGKLRGSAHRVSDIPVVVTYHPAYLLRRPSEKSRSWADLCLAQRTFKDAA
ncbi:MAG: uracil-DNA glycosylase [Pseudomonadota bacterium]